MATAYGEAETHGDDVDILGLSATIVAAYVAQNTVARTAIPEEYRRKWSLPGDYPMVAPAYAERRSDFAKSIGLGKGKMRGR